MDSKQTCTFLLLYFFDTTNHNESPHIKPKSYLKVLQFPALHETRRTAKEDHYHIVQNLLNDQTGILFATNIPSELAAWKLPIATIFPSARASRVVYRWNATGTVSWQNMCLPASSFNDRRTFEQQPGRN